MQLGIYFRELSWQNAKKLPSENTDMYNPAPVCLLDYLTEVSRYYKVSEIASRLDVEPSTVSRWLARESEPKEVYVDRLKQMLMPFGDSADRKADFTFIDLFAGIGGIRMGFEHHGGKCVFTSE